MELQSRGRTLWRMRTDARDAELGMLQDVELEAIRLGGHSEIEGCDRIFRPEIAPAAMREDLRPRRIEERHVPPDLNGPVKLSRRYARLIQRSAFFGQHPRLLAGAHGQASGGGLD